MRLQGHYRISLNGFECRTETYDAMVPIAPAEGFGDEIFFQIEYRHLDSNGAEIEPPVRRRTKTIGARGGGRYEYGSATDAFSITHLGGIATGDMFPGPQPWLRTNPFPNPQDVPPLSIWEGDLTSNWDGERTDIWINRPVTHENILFITPTIWESDPGQSLMQTWAQWQARADAEFGPKAKQIVSGVWPLTAPVFDAVSLGIQTANTLVDLLGTPATRPIGTQITRLDASHFELSFTPQVLDLSQARAEQIYRTAKIGGAFGVEPFLYQDSTEFHGDYQFWLEVERVGPLRQLDAVGGPLDVTPTGPVAPSTIPIPRYTTPIRPPRR